MARRPPLPLAEDGLPRPLRWRPVVKAKSIVLGCLLTIGGNLLLQQLGAATLTLGGLAWSLGLGILVGIAAPSLGRLVGVAWGNRILRKARARARARGPTDRGPQ